MTTTTEVSRASYEEIRQRHQTHFFQQLGPHLERLGWSAPRPPRAPDVASGTEADLARVPIMSKDDLMANFDGIVTDPRITLELANRHAAGLTSDGCLLDEHHAIASGGSSGRRGVYLYDWNGWTDWGISCLRYMLRMRQAAPASAREATTAVVMADVAAHGSSACPQTFRDAFGAGRVVRLPSSLAIEEIIEGLNACQPAVLMAYPSILAQPAAAARRRELSISPRLLCTSAEPLRPGIRDSALAQWRARIVNLWGTSEGGAIACGCGEGSGMHLSDDLVIVEPVDAEGRPVGPGQRSAKLYLTNLFNHALPLIRYELTDEVTLSTRTCPCRSAHRLVEDVQGRLEDRFVYPGVPPVHSLLFHTVLDPEPGIVEYQVRQTARGAEVDVVRSGPADLDALAREIGAKLAKAGVPSPAVTVREVSRIARPAGGKLKRFVPLVSAER
ncbi:MAG: phenylacetate--CoA ligase family protein [Gemmatimonadales bacterium]